MVFRSFIRPFVHALTLGIIFLLTYILRQHTDLIPGLQKRVIIREHELFTYSSISISIFLFFGIIRKRYTLSHPPKEPFTTFWKVRLYWLVTSTFVAYFGQRILFPGGISRLIILRTALLAAIIIPLLEHPLLVRCYKKKQHILFLYDKKENLHHTLSHRHQEQDVLFDTRKITKNQDVQEIAAIVSSGKYDSVICIGSLRKDYLEQLFDATRGKNIGFYHIAESFFLQDIIYTPVVINEILAFQYKASTLDERSLVVKRITDIVISFFSLLFLAPLFIIVAIAIKLDSPGPIFFVQTRVGKGGRLFRMYKFRSMIANAEAHKHALMKKNERNGPLFKITNDPRITRVGHFLRRTSIDELPQLRNVLKGDMSLVGPRPHLPEEVSAYEPWQKRLLSIKPGITGYAQIHGRDRLSFDQEAKYDLYYIQHRSLLLDFYIMVMTFKIIRKGK